jgi:hypothetical protein
LAARVDDVATRRRNRARGALLMNRGRGQPFSVEELHASRLYEQRDDEQR